MGFFDSASKQQPVNGSPVFNNANEALVAIMFSAMNADGNIDQLQIDALARSLACKASFKGHDVLQYYKNALLITAQHGGAAVISAAANTLTDTDKKTAFVITIDLVFANGSLNYEEQQFVDDLAAVLGLDHDWARTAIEIVLLRYN